MIIGYTGIMWKNHVECLQLMKRKIMVWLLSDVPVSLMIMLVLFQRCHWWYVWNELGKCPDTNKTQVSHPSLCSVFLSAARLFEACSALSYLCSQRFSDVGRRLPDNDWLFTFRYKSVDSQLIIGIEQARNLSALAFPLNSNVYVLSSHSRSS